MNILAISDLHWDMSAAEMKVLQSANESCQLCVLLGDIPLDRLRAIAENMALPTIGVLGNHDAIGLLDRAGIRDIHGKSVSVGGLQVAGISGSPRYKDDPDRPMYTQRESLAVEESLEAQAPADIIICHSAPYDRRADAPHRGFKSITRYMRRVRPAYVIHGHDHDDTVARKRYLLPRNGRTSVTVLGIYRVHVLELAL